MPPASLGTFRTSIAPLTAPRPLTLGGGTGTCSGAPPTIPAPPVSRHLGGASASQCRGLAATARHTQPAPLAAPAASHSLPLGLRLGLPLGPTHSGLWARYLYVPRLSCRAGEELTFSQLPAKRASGSAGAASRPSVTEQVSQQSLSNAAVECSIHELRVTDVSQ